MRWNGYLLDASDESDVDTRFFGTAPPDAESFQPIPENATFEYVETSYFGFNIPEHAIDGEIYVWFHRTLGVASGGITVWQGKKSLHLADECHDYRHFMPLPKELTDQSYPSGLTIRMTDASGEFLIEYEDPEQGHKLRLVTAPIMPLAVRPTGNHFTQAMKTRGELVLAGTHYDIDGFFTRDRTWAEPRTEKPIIMPPLTWIAGTFNDRFAFHVMAYDSIEHRPEWLRAYPLQPGENLLWGYIYHDGKLIGVTETEKRTVFDEDGITPTAYQLKITDAEGGIWQIKGQPIAMAPTSTWQNLMVLVSLNRWECNGLTGYGDAQEVLYGHHIRNFRQPLAR